MIRQLVSDFFGLWRVCGFMLAMRWGWNVVRNLGECRRRRDLQPADSALGAGPFEARLGKSWAIVAGPGIVTGIREIWVRDCYLANGFLSIGDGDVVVDLGANIGTFTMLALGHGPRVRVVALEPNAHAGASLIATAKLNGWENQLQLCQAFLGGKTSTQETLLATPEYELSPFLSEQQFIEQFSLTKIDLLKCDIEGSEFELLHRHSALLAMTRQLAVELHTAYGDPQVFAALLKELGFEVHWQHSSPTDCILNARRV
jgi:FkbM family methyltransferase